MNKANQKPGSGSAPNTNQADPVLAPQTITDTMENPAFEAEQLPELWQQAMGPDGAALTSERRDLWRHGIETMYRRCETYPQHAKLMVVLAGMLPGAWYDVGLSATQAHGLLKQATPEQIREALTWEQQHRPVGQGSVSNHVLAWAGIDQLTGPVIEQLSWNSGMATRATRPSDGTVAVHRVQRINEQIQNQLLDGDNNAWVVFLGIVEPGTRIGDAAELAKAIAQNRTVRH